MKKLPESFLSEENVNLRKSGCDLAIAAIEVIKNYDGIHRLSLAVSNWMKTIANEGGRWKEEEYETKTKEIICPNCFDKITLTAPVHKHFMKLCCPNCKTIFYF